MKRIIIALFIAAFCTTAVFAEGSQESSDSDVTTLTLALANPAADPWAQGLQKFADELEVLSGGTMKVDCFFGGQLYGASNLLAAVKAGKVDFAGFSMGSYPETPYLGMFQAAYLFRDAQHAQDFYASEIGQEIFDDVEEKIGVTVLGTAYVGTREVSLAKKVPDVMKPEDLNNITLRMPGSPSWAALAMALGANPVPISLNEVFMALKTGVVDGQDNALPTTKANSFDEVIDQLVLTDHVVWNLHLVANAERWSTFTEEQKGWIKEATKIGTDFTTKTFLETEKKLREEFAANGIRIVTPDKQAFMDYADDFYKNKTDVSETWNWDYYEAVKSF
ncbi:MAG: TRAP transporter substrate-binding protein DctP [Spirochaetales bacterium]|nr:TRAP transporter substrate-binding protein DctP [Spirochaetales bacterium]